MASETVPVGADIYRNRSIVNRRSLSIFSRRGTETPVQEVGPFVMRNPSSTAASKRRKSKKPGTILRAVPKAETSAPLSTLEQEMATSPNDEILSAIGRSTSTSGSVSFSSLPQNYPHPSRTYSVKASKLSPTFSRREKSSPKPITSSEDTIGVWKNGRVRWEGEPSIPLVRQASDAFLQRNPSQAQVSSASTKKNKRPKIQVIIPNDQRTRPFPSLGFFNSNPAVAKSATAEIGYGSDISPPSGTTSLPSKRQRQSVVSPLSAQKPKLSASRPLGLAELELLRPESAHKPKNSMSSSSEEEIDDGCSNYSKRSSMTSVEAPTPVEVKPVSLHERSGTEYPVLSPLQAGAFLQSPQSAATSDPNAQDVQICLQLPLSESNGEHFHGAHPALEHDTTFRPTCSLRQPRALSYTIPRRRVPSVKRRVSTRSIQNINKTLPSIPQADVLNQTTAREDFAAMSTSPTLSEAENDLEKHLTAIIDDDPFGWDDVVAKTPPHSEPRGPGEDLYGPPPVVPRKSSKRMSHLNPNFRLSRVPTNHIVSQLKRNRSKGKNLSIRVPPSKQFTEDFMLSPIPLVPRKSSARNITPERAENVILSILYSLESLDDLFSTAIVNKGFYRVFKRHELDLMKNALRKMSPPAWEHREICPPGDEDPDSDLPRTEYTATTYVQSYAQDTLIIDSLKGRIADQCQSILRSEMAVALSSEDQTVFSRADDALWRIWTFCKIFGSGKGREEDIVGQMDWLKGGELVHQQGCRATLMTTDSLDINGALASAPECFAKGNEGGLTAEQLYDMTELWNCLEVLLHGFQGKSIQAREYGVYENTDVRGGDIDGEEVMLDEWAYHLLTLGLSAVNALAGPCRWKDPSAFRIAAENGWMNWKPPASGGTRRNFLREALARVYEDKIASSFSSSSQKDMLRQLSKARVQRHITELRRRKNSGEQLREVRMSQERPISEWEEVFDRLTRRRPHSHRPKSKMPSPLPPLRSPPPTAPLPPVPSMAQQSPPRPRYSPPARTVAMPLLPTPPSTIYPSPAPTPARPVFAQHPLERQIYESNAADNTSEKAIYRIVEMGFTADQARYALKMTDLGDGLRVEAAVELLLRADN